MPRKLAKIRQNKNCYTLATIGNKKNLKTDYVAASAIGIIKNDLPKSNHVLVTILFGLLKKNIKKNLYNNHCTYGNRNTEIFIKKLSQENYVIAAVPLGSGILKISKEGIWCILCH